MTVRKYVGAMLATCLLWANVQAADSAAKENTLGQMESIIISEQPEYISIPSESVSFEELENILSQTKPAGDRAINYLHPAMGDAGNGYLIRGGERIEGTPEINIIWWMGSSDDGVNWGDTCGWDIYGATYPSVSYWGTGSQFYATFIPPDFFYGGGAVILLDFPDPTNKYTWDGRYALWSVYGWHSMAMCDVATDNSQQSWNWGFESLVMSRTHAEPDKVMDNAPLIFYQIDAVGNTWISWMPGYQQCQTTSCDIDLATHKTYAVFDRYNSDNDQYELLVRQDIFNDWDGGSAHLQKYYVDPDQHIIYPVVAAYNNVIIVIAATYNDSDPSDKDIVCYYTDDGNIANLDNVSLVAGTVDAENFPSIEHVTGNTFVCAYVKNNILYVCRTDDGGISWSPPEQASGLGETVVEE